MKNKQIADLALDNLNEHFDDILETYRYWNEKNSAVGARGQLDEVEVGSKVILYPTDNELVEIVKKVKKSDPGNLRTSQVLLVALHTFLDYLPDEISEKEVEEVISNIDSFVHLYPGLSDWRGWEVYGPDEDGHFCCIDKVFYGNTTNSQDVRNSLINHDNYDSSIVVR